MNNIYIYIVKCSDNSYYTGVTNNVDKRINEHNLGIDTRCYTYRRKPVELAYRQSFADPRDAIKAEKQIKGWSRLKKEALIRSDINKLKILSKCSAIVTLRQAQGDINIGHAKPGEVLIKKTEINE